MLVMAMNWSNVTPNHLIVPIKCYDLTTGLLVGSFDMALHTEYSSLSPLWCTSTALSPTEIIVSILRYARYGNGAEYYVQRILLSQSSEDDGITFTAQPILQVSNEECTMRLSPNGKFLVLQQDNTYIYKLDGSTVPRVFKTIESDNEKHISFHGDTLVIMEDKTLNVAAVHLPSLLEDWPEEYDEDNYTTLPTCSLGTTEGKRKLVCHQSGTFSVSSYNTATLESLDQHNGTATDSIPFSVAYLNEDRCFVLPVTIGGPGKDLAYKDVELHFLQNVVPAGVETEVARLPQTAKSVRIEGYPCQRTLALSDGDPSTKLRKHSIHVIGVDKPGMVRPLVSPPGFKDMDHATIRWIDETSGLIVMRGERKGAAGGPILVLWV